MTVETCRLLWPSCNIYFNNFIHCCADVHS